MTYGRLLVVTLALLGLALALPPRIEFVRPPAFVRQGIVPLKLRIPYDKDNRKYAVAAFDRNDGNQVAYRERDTHPDDLTVLEFELMLPSGDLAILAALFGTKGEVARTPLIPVCVYNLHNSCGEN
jgi:hypothetical protein